MSSLRVLITNNTLANRAGSELYVRDLATALLERGHRPVAYSTVLGEVADELRAATIPVVNDLALLAAKPDVIHGHHHYETMTALLRFPTVPAIYVCHGWSPWEEAPPRFPRIMQYVAVDYTCRDRLVCENAIPEDRVSVLLNFVDLRRFKPRDPLPARPKRALVFSNNAHEDNYLGAVRAACAHFEIELDVIGLGAGTVCAQPEEVLGNYDLVFAKARAALEALAVGTAVVLCDTGGTGPLVTTAELERLRSLNFGIRALRQPTTCDALIQEIARYDVADAAAVSTRIRAEAGREPVVDQLIELYQRAIAENGVSHTANAEAEARAAAAYLQRLSPRVKHRDHLWAESERERATCESAIRERDRLWKECEQLKTARDWLSGERESLSAERERFAQELARLQASPLFRLRNWLLRMPYLKAIYRTLMRRRAPG